MVMDIRLARIDDRLIHGQVATVWAKLTNINRILVVSDSVAHDNLRKSLVGSSCSTWCQSKCHHCSKK